MVLRVVVMVYLLRWIVITRVVPLSGVWGQGVGAVLGITSLLLIRWRIPLILPLMAIKLGTV